MGSGVVYEGFSYIYSLSMVATPQSNSSGLEKSIKVHPADVSWSGWMLSIVLHNKVWHLDIGGHLLRVMFSAKPFHLIRN